MKVRYGSHIIVCFVAALLGGVGCSNDDPTGPRNVAGQYALVATLEGSDNCFLGTTLVVPISIAQLDAHCALTTGTVGGPEVCGGLSEGNVGSTGVLPTDGETVFTDYWFPGCDLIQTDSWTLTIAGNGQTHGVWSIGYRDEPLNCSGAGVGFPCANSYDVAGLVCDGCLPSCRALAPGTARRPGTGWPRPSRP
jgi:hypothetical protein